jgi:hypothetical protein
MSDAKSMNSSAPPTSTAAFSRRLIAAAWAGLAAIAIGAVVSSAGHLTVRPLPEGVRSPTLALELMRDRALLPLVARDAADNAALVRSTWIDFAFIAAYTTFFALLGRALMARGWRGVGAIAIAVAVAAGVFDVVENVTMLSVLGGTGTGIPRYYSLTKWTLIFGTLAIVANVFVDRRTTALRQWLGYAAAALAWFVALEGGYAVLKGDDKLLEAAAQRMGTAFVLAEFFLATTRTLRDGVLAALDRLADYRFLRPLVNWPSDEEGDETVDLPQV